MLKKLSILIFVMFFSIVLCGRTSALGGDASFGAGDGSDNAGPGPEGQGKGDNGFGTGTYVELCGNENAYGFIPTGGDGDGGGGGGGGGGNPPPVCIPDGG